MRVMWRPVSGSRDSATWPSRKTISSCERRRSCVRSRTRRSSIQLCRVTCSLESMSSRANTPSIRRATSGWRPSASSSAPASTSSVSLGSRAITVAERGWRSRTPSSPTTSPGRSRESSERRPSSTRSTSSAPSRTTCSELDASPSSKTVSPAAKRRRAPRSASVSSAASGRQPSTSLHRRSACATPHAGSVNSLQTGSARRAGARGGHEVRRLGVQRRSHSWAAGSWRSDVLQRAASVAAKQVAWAWVRSSRTVTMRATRRCSGSIIVREQFPPRGGRNRPVQPVRSGALRDLGDRRRRRSSSAPRRPRSCSPR